MHARPNYCRILAALLAAASAVAGTAAPATGQSGRTYSFHVTAGSDTEDYLRALQVAGIAPEYPWSLRAFARRELDSLTRFSAAHPWSNRYRLQSPKASLSVLPLEVATIVNSAFPWGSNDGPVWAGRGATVSVSAGVQGKLGPLSFAVNPMAFRAANAHFELAPNGQAGRLAFGDVQFPGRVDRPQRFGDAPYSRIDPGNSYVRFDGLGFAAGVSTANEFWGPATMYPFILGNNAPGFIHGFLGTSRPVRVGVGRAHMRLQWSRLEQSDYSPVTGAREHVSSEEPGHSRFAPGLVFVLQPRGTRGLELGMARFFHLFLPAGGVPWSYWTKPLQAPFSQNSPSDSFSTLPRGAEANQLASLFARWVFPAAGVEAYAEYGREDYNANLRDALQEPDHQRSYMLGLGKVFSGHSGRLHSLRAELINFQMSGLAQTRTQGSVYLHSQVRQGHTHRGQLLGAGVGVDAAAGSSVQWESYTQSGKWAVRWSRTVARERGEFHETGVQERRTVDATHEIDASTLIFTRMGDVSLGAAIVREFNRNFADDAWNLQARFGLRRPF